MFAHKIIDYQQLIDKSTREFVGRDWVRGAVDDFLHAVSPRIFLLLGEPGSGKTAFMADLVKRRGYLHHFIGRGSRADLATSLEWRDPIRFAESIGYQLLRDYGGWVMRWEDWGIQIRQNVKELKGRLAGASVEEFYASPRTPDQPMLLIEQKGELLTDPATHVIGVFIEKYVMDVKQIVLQLLFNPLRSVAERWPDRPLILVVDGLDEAADDPNPEVRTDYPNSKIDIMNILTEVDLPANVRFLISSRPGKHLSRTFLESTQRFWLSADEDGELNPLAMKDARIYLWMLSKEPLVSERLRVRQTKHRDFVEGVVVASSGNFLYLFHYAGGLREGLGRGDETLLDLKALPQGLYGIYENFLRKISAPWGVLGRVQIIKPALGILAIACEPLSRAQLADFSGVEHDSVGTLLEQITQFLDVTKTMRSTRYAIYHKSFAEFLVSEGNEDYISSGHAHARVADYFLDAWGGLVGGLPLLTSPEKRQLGGGYGLRHLASHLEGSGEMGVKRLHLLLSTPRADGRNAWAEAKAESGDISGYLADVMSAWKLAEKSSAISTETTTPGESIGLEARYALMTASVTSSVKRISPAILPYLLRAQVWSPPRALSYLQQFDAATRVKVLTEFRTFLPTPRFQEAVDAESSAVDVDYELSLNSPPEPTYAAWLLRRYRDRFDLFSSGATPISDRLVRSCLDKARHIKSDLKRALYLVALSAYSSDSRKAAILEELWAMARKMHNRYGYVALLTPLVPHLNAEQAEEVLHHLLSSLEVGELGAWARDMLRTYDDLSDGHFISQYHAFAIEDQRLHGARDVEVANLSTEQFRQWLLKLFIDNPILLRNDIFSMIAEITPRLEPGQLRRVIAAIFAIPDDDEKAGRIASLIPRLPSAFMPEVVQATATLKAEKIRFRVLAESAHHCSAQVQDTALKEAAIAINRLTSTGDAESVVEDNEESGEERWKRERELGMRRDYWIESLSKLSANLPALDPAPLLTLIGSAPTGEERTRREALLRLAPHLREPLLAEAIKVAREFTSSRERVAALAGILPFVSEPARTALRMEALEQALTPDETLALRSTIAGEGTVTTTKEEIDEAGVIELAPYLSEDELKRVLKKVREIDVRTARHEMLIALAPFLSTPILCEMLEEVQAIHDGDAQAELLSACVDRLLEVGCCQEALEVAKSIKDAFLLTSSFLRVAPHFTPEFSEGILAEARTAARGVDPSYYRRRGDLLECFATTLADVAEAFTDPTRGELLEEAINSEMSAREHPWHEAVLTELCGRLSRLGSSKKALAMADAIEIKDYYAQAIATVGRHAPEGLLREVLIAVSGLKDQRLRAGVLSHLAPVLPQHLRTEALQMALAIEGDKERVAALTSFIPFLLIPQQEEIEKTVLNMLIKTEDSVEKVFLLAFFAVNSSEESKAVILEYGLNATRRLQQPQDRAHAVASLVPHLSESQLREVLEIIHEIEDLYWHESALTDACGRVAKLLGPRQALDMIRGIEAKPLRANALGILAEYLDEQLLREALRLTATLHPSNQQFYRDNEVLHVSEGWSREKRHVRWSPQVAAFSKLAPNAPMPVRAEVRMMWQEILRQVAGEDRKDSLTQIAMLSSALNTLGGTQALIACARAVQDVARWWP